MHDLELKLVMSPLVCKLIITYYFFFPNLLSKSGDHNPYWIVTKMVFQSQMTLNKNVISGCWNSLKWVNSSRCSCCLNFVVIGLIEVTLSTLNRKAELTTSTQHMGQIVCSTEKKGVWINLIEIDKKNFSTHFPTSVERWSWR